MTELAAQLAKTFIARRDVKAVQQSNGIYVPDRTTFMLSDVEDHLAGRRSLGHYLVTPEGKTRVIAFDLDLIKADGSKTDANGTVLNPPIEGYGDEAIDPRGVWRTDHPASGWLTVELQRVAVGLAIKAKQFTGSPTAISFSGSKGLHVYSLPGKEIEAQEAMEIAAGVMEFFCWEPRRGKNFWHHPAPGIYDAIEVETFPKQGKLDSPTGLGNLLRLPLGVNRKSGQRSFFLMVEPPMSTLSEWDPMEALSGQSNPWASE